MHRSLTPLLTLCRATTSLVQDLGTRLICVADRDALIPQRSIPYFNHLAHLRQQYPDLKFGGITNGLSLHHYLDTLPPLHLDYLDISIDGPQPIHDALRGAGTYACVLSNLRLAHQHTLAERIIVATTLTEPYWEAAITLVPHLIQTEGVQWFTLSPLFPVKLSTAQLQPNTLPAILQHLTRTLAALQPPQAVTILVEIPTYSTALLSPLIAQGWLQPTQLRQDLYGSLYQDIPLNPRITLTLRPALIPDYWWHTLRISADGYVLGGCEFLADPHYPQQAIGNIQSEPITRIYARASPPPAPCQHRLSA